VSAVEALPVSRAPFWRMEEPDLDANGRVLRGGMWSHQRQWWNLPNAIRCLVTGYGGGKTIMLGKRMVWLALVNAPVPVLTVSPSYPMARTTIVETIDELLDGRCTIEPHLTYHLYQSNPYRFSIRLGDREATILCMSGERPDSIKGINAAAAGIDEPFVQPKAVFDQVTARIRHPASRLRELNITGTPEGVVGWGYDLIEGEDRAKHDIGVVQCSSLENRALPDGYVANMVATFDESSRQAYVDGRFVNMTSGRVYHSFDPLRNMQSDAVEMPKGAQLGVGMDFNVDPMAFVFFWRTPERLHFFAEHELPNCDAEQAGIEIKRLLPEVRDVYPDASGAQRSHAGNSSKSAFVYLREQGFTINARAANPLLPDRRNAVNSGFRRGHVTIGKSCPKLKTYLMAYTHEGANKAAQKKMSHLLDAFSYPIAFLFPVDRQAMRLVSWR